MIAAATKTCIGCGETKPVDRFWVKSPAEPGKRHAQCSDCRNRRKRNIRNGIESPRKPIPETIECVSCRKVKHNDYFHKAKENATGRSKRCKQCVSEEHAALRKAAQSLELPAEKTCARCKQTQPKSEYWRNYRTTDTLDEICKSCSRAKHAARKYKADESWQRRLAETKTCDACGVAIGYKGDGVPRKCLDHCHSSGDPRGILCGPCNLMIGMAKDVPERLEMAAAYLRRVSSNKADGDGLCGEDSSIATEA